MSEAGGEFAECGELFALLLSAGDAADAVGKQVDETPRKFRHSLEEFRKVGGGKRQKMGGSDGTTGDGNSFQTGERQHARHFSGGNNENRAVGASTLGSCAHFTVEHNDHVLRGIAFVHNDITGSEVEFLALGNKPGEIVMRKILKNAHGAKLDDEVFGG
jgi:hypothetical protein